MINNHIFFKYFIFYSLGLIFLGSCATQKIELAKVPVPFDTAIPNLAQHFFQKIKYNQYFLSKTNKINIVLDPVVDVSSGEVIQVSRQIEQIFLKEGQSNFKHLRLARLTPKNLRDAQYVINGIIHFDDYKKTGTTQAEKYYRVSMSVLNLETQKIIADSSIWILEQDLDYTPMPFYQDSPIYLKDNRIENLKNITESPLDESSDAYYNSLDTHALLVEAETFYEHQDYPKALWLFQKAQQRPDGQLMRTYAGLYQTHSKLERNQEAEQSFAQLLILSVNENKKINIKFLFEVNSAEFIEDIELKKEYSFWLQMIVQYFKDNNQCFNIVGHCSHTGSMGYNDKLSLARALTVQQLMQHNFSAVMQRSNVEGKGFRENLVGSGTDDARDAIDRRVEIVVVNCSQL
jgi:outer membrane protein OmpA-like peptidoglycan-associated protein